MFNEILETTFGLFYVMTEGLDHDGSAQKTRVSVFLVLIDMGQVLRTITNKQFGWSAESKIAMSWIDIVYIVTELLQQVIPRVVFFVAAVVLIIGALADTFYVARIFKAGRVKNMLPVKILRFLVGAIVTTLFTTVLEWVLFPMECLLEGEDYGKKSLSTLLRGEEHSCTPFGSPEIAVTVPTVAITAVYVAYSLVTTLLSFEINPLSRNPWAHSTGRVEMVWTAVKVAAAGLPFLSEFLSRVVISLLLVGMSAMLLCLHITHMPFHDLTTNVVRGGVYGGVLWLSIASVIVSSYATSDDSMQVRQWVLLAVLPALFTGAAVLVYQRQLRIYHFVHLLRGQFAALHQHNSEPHSMQDDITGWGLPDFGGLEDSKKEASVPDDDFLQKTVFDKFYDLDYERNRAFKTGPEALTVARAVLYSRKKTDMPFLQYLVHRALTENPECEELLVFQFLVHRFINYHDQMQSTHRNRLSKLQNLPLTLDLRYLLYAVNRRANQDFASAHLGKGAVSAINVMEFEGRMERARRAHLDCIVHMKGFWKAVRKSKREEMCHVSAVTIEETIYRLEEFNRAFVSAGLEYDWLLDKYSGSVAMLNSYAHFCDAVLNNEAEADKRRKQAEVLDNVTREVEELSDEENNRLEQATASISTTGSESARTVAAKYMQSWSHIIMAKEVQSLRTLTRRVRWLMLLLTVLVSVGFVLTSNYLFRDIAKKNILLIDKTGLFRAYSTGSCYLLRSQMIAAQRNDTAGVDAMHRKLVGISHSLRTQHKLNYEAVSGGDLRAFYNDEPVHAWSPVAGDAEWKLTGSSYWSLANDLARRIDHASRGTIADYQNRSYDPVVASASKLSVSYIVENAFRVLVPTFETVVGMYDEQVQDFGWLTLSLVYSNASVNALIVVGIAFFVLRALLHVIQTVQYKYISCWLALSLPPDAVKKLYRFYFDQEAMLNDLESDDEDKAGDNDDVSDAGPKHDTVLPGNSPGRDDDRDAAGGVWWATRQSDHARRGRVNGEDLMGASPHPRFALEGPEDGARWRGRDHFGSGGSGGENDGRSKGYRNRHRDEAEEGLFPRCNSGFDDGRSGGNGEGGSGVGWRAGQGRTEQWAVGGRFGCSEADDSGVVNSGQIGDESVNERRSEGARASMKVPAKVPGRVEPHQTGGMRDDDDAVVEEEAAGQSGDARAGGGAGKKMSALFKGVGASFKHMSFTWNSKSDLLENRFKAVEVTDETKALVQHALHKKQAWFSRWPVYVGALSVMLGLCLLSILYPARVVDQITNLPQHLTASTLRGPTTNQAGRRRYLTRACVHLSRELVLNDGWMRMNKATVHGALAWHLEQLRRSNRAVRLGDELGISEGADWRGGQHNRIMYDGGCQWRETPEEADCRIDGQPKVKINGLYSVLLNFYDAVEAVMSSHGVDPAEATAAYERYLERDANDVGPAFNEIKFNQSALDAIASDENLQFILAAFAGDMFQGLGATLIAFQHETAQILDGVQFESRVLYACYMVLVVVVFYGTLFRKTVLTAELEVVKARGFVHKLPTYTLAKEETDVIREFFQNTLEHS